MLPPLGSPSTIKTKDRIIAWILLVLHALALGISLVLLLSPNNLWNRQSGLASVKLDMSALVASPNINGSSPWGQDATPSHER